MAPTVLRGVVLLLLCFVLVRMGAAALHGYRFQQAIQDSVNIDTARPNPDTRAMRDRVLEQARVMGLRLERDDVDVQGRLPGYQVRVRFGLPLDFYVYERDVNIEFTARSQMVSSGR